MDAMVQPKLDRYLRIIGQYDSEFAKWAADNNFLFAKK